MFSYVIFSESPLIPVSLSVYFRAGHQLLKMFIVYSKKYTPLTSQYPTNFFSYGTFPESLSSEVS